MTRIKPNGDWFQYPEGTKAHAFMGGFWYKMPNRFWKWNGPKGNGGSFPRPGGDAIGACIELPSVNQCHVQESNHD